MGKWKGRGYMSSTISGRMIRIRVFFGKDTHVDFYVFKDDLKKLLKGEAKTIKVYSYEEEEKKQ